MSSRILTVGHSNHSAAGMLDLLRKSGVAVHVDVRSALYSLFCPQFTKPPLGAALSDAGIRCHRRRPLGRVLASRDVEILHLRGDGSLDTEAELAARGASGWTDLLGPVCRRSQRLVAPRRHGTS